MVTRHQVPRKAVAKACSQQVPVGLLIWGMGIVYMALCLKVFWGP